MDINPLFCKVNIFYEFKIVFSLLFELFVSLNTVLRVSLILITSYLSGPFSLLWERVEPDGKLVRFDENFKPRVRRRWGRRGRRYENSYEKKSHESSELVVFNSRGRESERNWRISVLNETNNFFWF